MASANAESDTDGVVETDMDGVVRDNPEMMERLKDGDPLAIVDLLRAAGAEPRTVKIRVHDRALTTGRRTASR